MALHVPRVSNTQAQAASASQGKRSLSISTHRSAYLGTAVNRLPYKFKKAINVGAAAKQIKCQAFEYSLDPSIAKFDYQPAELPNTTVQTCDFLVLGSGIACLTYALKVY